MTSMNSWREKALPSLSLALATVLLSMVAALIAAVPLRALRRISGRKVYWTFSIVSVLFFVMFKSYFAALSLTTLVILIGSFSEYENSGDSLVKAAACAILTTLASWALGFLGVWSVYGKQTLVFIKLKAAAFTDLVSTMYLQYNTNAELTAADIQGVLFSQAPSLVLMGLMMSLFLAVLLEKRIVGLFQSEIKAPTYRLSFFKVHDIIVWAFIFSLLGSFTVYENETLKVISLNTFYVSLMLLFFQGLAVTAHFFNVTKMSSGWRVFWYYVLIVHLTLSLSILGLMDYWLNFRMRISKRAAAIRKSDNRIGEEK